MQTIEIFILDNLIPFLFLALVAVNIYGFVTRKSKRPKYAYGQEVLGQNYKSGNGDYIPVKIAGVITIWPDRNNCYHRYEVESVVNKYLKLTLIEDRIKPKP